METDVLVDLPQIQTGALIRDGIGWEARKSAGRSYLTDICAAAL